jgi:hypothetical protein
LRDQALLPWAVKILQGINYSIPQTLEFRKKFVDFEKSKVVL